MLYFIIDKFDPICVHMRICDNADRQKIYSTELLLKQQSRSDSCFLPLASPLFFNRIQSKKSCRAGDHHKDENILFRSKGQVFSVGGGFPHNYRGDDRP